MTFTAVLKAKGCPTCNLVLKSTAVFISCLIGIMLLFKGASLVCHTTKQFRRLLTYANNI